MHALRRGWAWAGASVLALAAWVSMYGKIASFERLPGHRFTAMAMLTGTLRMRGVVVLADHDEQVFNGAVYTNWGFGVPLLQAPFHALATALHGSTAFFPDRAIYFAYLLAAMPLLWAAFERLLAMRDPQASPRDRRLVSWAATFLVLAWIVFPMMQTRFIVYEETVAYFLVFELLAIGAYIFSRSSESTAPLLALGLASGIALLVRATGLVYVGVFATLIVLERRPRRRAAAFAAAAAPCVAFWLYSNWVRTGSLTDLGFENANPFYDYDVPIQRFGAGCADTVAHGLWTAGRLFSGIFLFVSPDPAPASWMGRCHFTFEERDHMGDPFLGPAVLVLIAWTLARRVARRERRLAPYVPYAAFAALFASFVLRDRGASFAWRYASDFWPLVVLACVMHVEAAGPGETRPVDGRLARLLFFCGLAMFARYLVPWEWKTRAELATASDVASMVDVFHASRWGVDPPLPGRLSCGDPLPKAPYRNGSGWDERCSVGVFTNVYLGVAPKQGDRYALRLRTEGAAPPSLRVYVNGTLTTAARTGDGYEAHVPIRFAALHSPIVMATIQWTRGTRPPPIKLLSIELS